MKRTTSRLARLGHRRGRLVLLAELLVLAVSGGVAIFATAAQLAVDSPDLSEFWGSPCTHDPLSVRVQPAGFGASRSAVRITNVPTECFGNTFEVAVSDSGGNLLASGSATCSTANCQITTGTYNAPSVTDAHALASTWGIPASWDTTCTYIIFFWWCN